MLRSNKFRQAYLTLLFLGFASIVSAIESGTYRLLSISDSEKIILVSQIPGKTKLLLDAASAKITLNGKAAEFKELRQFSIIQVKMDLVKKNKNGIDIDGTAAEIKITNPEQPK